MASYIPWYGKKREHLAEREHEFLPLLQNGSDLKRLREAAEMVRLAKVRALKAERARWAPSERSADAIANLDREIQFWLALTPDQVIDGYRNGSLCRHRAMRKPAT